MIKSQRRNKALNDDTERESVQTTAEPYSCSTNKDQHHPAFIPKNNETNTAIGDHTRHTPNTPAPPSSPQLTIIRRIGTPEPNPRCRQDGETDGEGRGMSR